MGWTPSYFKSSAEKVAGEPGEEILPRHREGEAVRCDGRRRRGRGRGGQPQQFRGSEVRWKNQVSDQLIIM